MIEFILSVVAIYFIFRGLDHLFARRHPTQIREGEFVQKIGDEYFIVREVPEKIETPVVPHRRRPGLRVVK